MAESVELHERVTRVEKQAAETHALAAATDKEVADYRAVLNGNKNVLNSLRETQLEHGATLDLHSAILKSHDKRLDNLERKVDEGFARMEARFAQVDEGFRLIGLKFGQVDAGFRLMESKFAILKDGQERITELLTGRPDGQGGGTT